MRKAISDERGATDLNLVHEFLTYVLRLRSIKPSEADGSPKCLQLYPCVGDSSRDPNRTFADLVRRFNKTGQRCEYSLDSGDITKLFAGLRQLRKVTKDMQDIFDEISDDAREMLKNGRLDWPEFPDDYTIPEWGKDWRTSSIHGPMQPAR
jgi:hypothetical protein